MIPSELAVTDNDFNRWLAEANEERYARAKAEWCFLRALPDGPDRYEVRTGENFFSGGMLYLPDADGVRWYVPAIWTVCVYFRPQWKDWAVQAWEDHLEGLVVPDGPRAHKTLAKARDDAEGLFAVLTGAPRRESWPYRTKSALAGRGVG